MSQNIAKSGKYDLAASVYVEYANSAIIVRGGDAIGLIRQTHGIEGSVLKGKYEKYNGGNTLSSTGCE